MTALVIPGPLRGKGRPRFARATGRAYTPADTLTAEQRIQAAAYAAGLAPLDGPVRVHVAAIAAPAPSWSKRKTAAALALRYDMRKPDADNVLKLVLDALNGIAWRDDVQVVDARVERLIQANGPLLIIHIDPARVPMDGAAGAPLAEERG